MNAPAIITPDRGVDAYRMSTDAAGICRDIVIATASTIGGKSYVGVEGWQAIAVAHGCAASADHVERVTDDGMTGFKAVGIVRRMSDGVEIARGEGFLGDDEGTWSKRPVYARRAMVQTRAISRACRSAFAHVVVMMKADLSTTPAEEVPAEGFDNRPRAVRQEPQQASPQRVVENEQQRRAPPLTGPIKTRSAIRIACGNFARELEACGDDEMLEALLVSEKPLLDQIQDEARFYWEGDGADFLGLDKEIQRRRELIAMQEAA